MTLTERIAAALYEHQGWKHDGAPVDECDCCSAVVLDALCPKGERVVLDRTRLMVATLAS